MRVALPLDGGGTEKKDPSRPRYWKAENHVDMESGLRVENWMKPIRHLVLGHADKNKTTVVNLTHEAGTAILRYVEEVKMFGNLRDHDMRKAHGGKTPSGHPEEARTDPGFLDSHWKEEVLGKWPSSKVRGPWLKALEALEKELDSAVAKAKGDSKTGAAFVKLSVRSPKDAVFNRKRFFEELELRLPQKNNTRLSQEGEGANSPPSYDTSKALELSVRIEAIRYASWQSLKCRSGKDAMELLLRSERVYLDVLQHELFIKGDKTREFNLNVHVSPFVESFDPALEFRGFVANHRRTAITAYSPFVFDQRIVKSKDKIWKKIDEVWSEAESKLEMKDYSIDFCLSPDLESCSIVEINAFLPPLAGCGLFDYNDEGDRKLMLEGNREFEFRIKSTPLVEQDFVKERKDETTGKTTKMIMKPAPPHVMLFAEGIQNRTATSPTWAPTVDYASYFDTSGAGAMAVQQSTSRMRQQQPTNLCACI
mmetsp:Transcript_15996/g.28704  ORF Transcript_15996/g.28704 Transcript_15996/m.28704 type:complete len:481 (+) Transcript_15996:192-1634(+)